MAVVPYADATYGDAYFADRLGTTKWDAADAATKAKALAHATRLIDTLNYISRKYDDAQEREFPRSGFENTIPTEVQDACCEVALELLNGKFPESADGSVGKTSEAVGDASVSYSDGGRDLYSENMGLPSRTAARLLHPWLRNPRSVRLRRVN